MASNSHAWRKPCASDLHEIERVRASKYFNKDYYTNQFNLDWAKLDPAAHFCATWREHLCSPSEDFNVHSYLDLHPDAFAYKTNPISHSLDYGYAAARSITAKQLNNLRIEDGNLYNIKLLHKRIAIFASCNREKKVKDYLVNHLEALRSVCDAIIFISACYYPFDELLKIRHLINYFICSKHGEGFWGSYRDGLSIAEKYNLLQKCNEIFLCNDSVYGPFLPYDTILGRMANQNCAFWGITNSCGSRERIHSYFLAFKKNILAHPAFNLFFKSLKQLKDDDSTRESLEADMLQYFTKCGFSSCVLADCRDNAPEMHSPGTSWEQLRKPAACLSAGVPFISHRAFHQPAHYNEDGIIRTLETAARISRGMANMLRKEWDNTVSGRKFPFFSVIMPAWNRADCIVNAINSALAQTYVNFELIVIDDGSTDNTEAVINDVYKDALATRKIVYIKLPTNSGVSHARNIGLKNSRYEWIAYLDSDNTLVPRFLETYAWEIMANQNVKTFYSKILRIHSGEIIGKKFDHEYMATRENLIDMGSFVHHKSLVAELGEFDEKMHRFVDYDLILRYTGKYTPIFIDAVLTEYNDSDRSRITNSINQMYHHQLIRHKHAGDSKITTILLGNAEAGINARTLASALGQMGSFCHELAIYTETDACGHIKKWQKGLPLGNPASRAEVFDNTSLLELADSSTASYFTFLANGDCWLFPRRLEKQLAFMRLRPELDLSAGYCQMLEQTGQKDRHAPLSSIIMRRDALLNGLKETGDLKLALAAIWQRVSAGEALPTLACREMGLLTA